MHKTPTSGPITRCQICESPRLVPVLALGHHPILQKYLTERQLQEPEATYPLNLVYCRACGLAQLDYCIDPAVLFNPGYPYRTGLTGMLIRNFDSLAEELLNAGHYKKGDLVVDIGSNDGTLLSMFKKRGARVVGVEPTNVARIARTSGIPTLQHFFGRNSVKEILKKYGTPNVITATNAFAHITDLPALIKNIRALMGRDTVFVSESQYLLDIVEKLEFDTIYDEHLRYYALKPMARMFGAHGMSLVDAERIQAAGGSIRVYAKKGGHPMSRRAKELLRKEKKAGLYDLKTLSRFARRVYKAKHELMALLSQLKKSGARIAALTSAGRSNTLLNFVKIDHTLIDYTGEKKGSPKIGLYTPGGHIPIVDEKRIVEEQPEFLLILSWHIGSELMRIMRKLGYKGRFIMPLPKPRIIK